MQSFAAAPAPGAGRLVDVTWDNFTVPAPITVAPPNRWLGRGSSVQNGAPSLAQTGAAHVTVVYRGRPCARSLTDLNNPALALSMGNSGAVPLLERPPYPHDVVDATVWRYVVIAALPPLGALGATRDLGLEFGFSLFGGGRMRDNTTDRRGFGILQSLDGTGYEFLARKGVGALTEQTALVMPAGFDPAALNVWDVRILSATPDADARVRFLLNGRELVARSWGAGSALPAWSDAAGQGSGFFFSLVNTADAAGAGYRATHLAAARYIVAGSEAATL